MAVLQSSSKHFLTANVYLNHLSPAEAQGEGIRRNITMALVGIVLWDIFTYIPSDLKIIRETRFCFVILCFIMSRLMIVVYMMNAMLHRILPMDHDSLNALWYSAAASVALVIIASSYLFLRRVLAVYRTGKWVRGCFIVSWVLLSIISGIVIPVGGKPTLFPGTRYFMTAKLKHWVALCDWGLLAFDTAVVVAVSLKLGGSFGSNEYCSDNNRNRTWYGVLTGRHLPRFARAILRGGQLYYLVTVGVLVFVGIVMSLPIMDPVYGESLITFFVFFSGSMACRVFRNVKLFDFGGTSMDAFSDVYALQYIER